MIALPLAVFLVKREQDIRKKAAGTTLQDLLTATGISNMVIGNPYSVTRDDSIQGLYTVDAASCVPTSDRYEVTFNTTIPNIYGAGIQSVNNQSELVDFLDPSFSSGSFNDPNMKLNPDIGRMRTPVFIFPKQNLIIGYIQPFPKIVRLTRANGVTTLVMKKNDQYNEGICGQFFAVKGNSISDTYTKYNAYLKRRFFFKQPHWNAFGLGWETYQELGCSTSLSSIKNAWNQYKSVGIPLSMLTIGSGYWNSTNKLGCGNTVNNDPNAPTMDAMSLDPSFGTIADMQNFYNQLTADGIYPMLGMRHTISPQNVANVTAWLRNDGLDPSIPIYFPNDTNPYTLYGSEPSNNVRLLNILPRSSDTRYQPVIEKYIGRLLGAYGSFKGIKEDEMLMGDQKAWIREQNLIPSSPEYRVDPNTVNNLPDGGIKNVYSAYAKYFNNDFIIMGRNDYFGVGSDIQNGPGSLPGLPAGSTYAIKYWLDTDFVSVSSGYPHPKIEPKLALNADGTITDQKQFLRTAQLLSFLPVAYQSQGFWRLTDQTIKSQVIYFSKLREQIRRYVYDNAMRWYITGVPSLMRPLYIDYPNDPNSYTMYTQYSSGQVRNEYMMGNALLVRPVFDANDSLNIYFPEGTWYNIFSGQQFSGGQTSQMTLNSSNLFPVFAKGGEPFILQNSLADSYTSRVRIFPANSYQTTYVHYLPNGNPSGTLSISIQGTWNPGGITIKDQAGIPVSYVQGPLGDVEFNMQDGKSYTFISVQQPTSTPTSIPSPTKTLTPTATRTPTPSPTKTVTPTPTKTPTPSSTRIPTPSLTFTLTPTSTVNPTNTTRPTNTPTLQPVPGDANGDRKVDGIDYTIWLLRYGQRITGYSNGDFNSDGNVDGIDFVIWLNNYGT